MHFISIQIQPEGLNGGSQQGFDPKEFLARVRAVGRSPEIDEFEEKGQRHLHFTFFTERPKQLWQELQEALYNNSEYGPVIRPISVAVCESESQGQANQFFLLHHFDPREKLDRLP